MLDCIPQALPEPEPEQTLRVAGLIDVLLGDARSQDLVRTFYDPSTKYAGDTFLGLAPNEPYAIGIPDLYAVTLLGVNPGTLAARMLLPGGRLANRTAALLARIPLGVPLWKASDIDLAWADCLWRLLVREVHGIRRTIAGKLLVRKRPELIPVVDSVVAVKLACRSRTYWTTLRQVLQDPTRRARIAALADHVPELRVLDTLMWMHWRSGGLPPTS